MTSPPDTSILTTIAKGDDCNLDYIGLCRIRNNRMGFWRFLYAGFGSQIVLFHVRVVRIGAVEQCANWKLLVGKRCFCFFEQFG
jgi:hypothetical protein